MKKTLYILLLFISTSVFGRQTEKYWVYYQDTATAVSWRDSMEVWGIEETYYSEWLIASSVSIDSTQRGLLLSQDQLQIQKQGYLLTSSLFDESDEKLSYALEQIGANHFIENNLTGKGVKIGIIDGGFLGAPDNPNLSHFFSNQQIAAYKDFITPKLKAYGGSSNLDDQHGTEVWEMLGGYSVKKKIRYGMATGATYYLARTDHGAGEKRIEEEYFVKALEWMHQQGVRLVNTSLGYTNGYDDESENYTPDQMDGSSGIAKATQYAIDEKGMVVVGAAGNEGNLPWKVINTPADAKDVIAVGASKNKLMDKMSYSSIGPLYLNYLKPELTCYSSTGTSFAAPIITGLIACMMEYNQKLTNKQIREVLLQSCDLYPYGNNYVGYGNPNGEKIINWLKNNQPMRSDVKPIQIKPARVSINKLLGKPSKKSVKYKFKPKGQSIVIYHKYDGWKVLEKKITIHESGRLQVRKPEKATQTTIVDGSNVYELFWN